jgi:hypothetical protein
MFNKTAEDRLEDQRKQAANRRHQLQLIGESLDTHLNEFFPERYPVPTWVRRLVAKARKGNVKALVGLKCAECTCWQTAEIKNCEMTGCPLHAVRPFRQ